MTLTTKDEFFQNTKRRYRDVPLLTGGTFRIQSLTSTEMRRFKASLINKKGDLDRRRSDNIEVLLIAQCVVNESGDRIFTDAEALSSDFGRIDGAVITHLFNECKEHTGFTADEDLSSIEDSIKNSQATDDDNSS